MAGTLAFIQAHGYAILFAAVLAEQMGLPIPSVPMLLAIGALAGMGQVSFIGSLLLAMVACLIADGVWYWLGVYRGSSILKLLCKISLEPDSCVRRTEDLFVRYGARGLLFAKFVPGLSTAAAPLAGMFRMHRGKFLLADGAGSFIWAGAYIGLGWIFRNQLETLAGAAERMGSWLLGFIVLLLASYLGWKYYQRQRFYRELRMSRITADQLHDLYATGDEVAVIDLRNALEWEEDGASKLPGAIHMSYEDLNSRKSEIPLDRDVILYCT